MVIEISDRTYDLEFVEKLQEISGEAVTKCMQCGTCSAMCPLHEHADVSPRRIILFSQFGMKEKIYSANTVWLCATCNACMAKCPRGLDLTKVMEAIRQMALRENKNFVEPNQIPVETWQEMPQIALVSCFRKHTS